MLCYVPYFDTSCISDESWVTPDTNWSSMIFTVRSQKASVRGFMIFYVFICGAVFAVMKTYSEISGVQNFCILHHVQCFAWDCSAISWGSSPMLLKNVGENHDWEVLRTHLTVNPVLPTTAPCLKEQSPVKFSTTWTDNFLAHYILIVIASKYMHYFPPHFY